MLVKTTTLLAAASALASANPVPLAYPNTLATRLECTGPPSITLRAGEWTRVEGLEGDQGGFGGPSAAWRLSIARGAYSEERFTLVTYKVGSGEWSDAVAAKDGLQEDKRFDVSVLSLLCHHVLR
jgi:hypothetical protein